MGYHSINSAHIHRDYKTRTIIVDVYDEEMQRHEIAEFGFDALDSALAWLKQKMEETSM